MIPLLLIIIVILIFGVVGAIKIAFWTFLIALAIAVVAAFIGRSAFSR
jgi:hypothetical protein